VNTIALRLRVFTLLLFSISLVFFHSSAHAQQLLSTGQQPQHSPDQQHYLLAQTDPDEAFDPFTDYSEFDEESDEEADINFFRNGRFLTAGLVGGFTGFTGNFQSIYGSGPSFGLDLTYFFDLRMAMSLSLMTGDHSVNFTVNNGSQSYTGNLSLTIISFNLKYYMNTQNVTRGLADLNPYILGGVGQFYRTYTISGLDGSSKDSAMGFNAGAGIELPLMRKKAFLGLQAVYHYVNFSDESDQFVDGTQKLDKTISGQFYDVSVILGMNF